MQAIWLALASCFLAVASPLILLSVPKEAETEPITLMIETASAAEQDEVVLVEDGKEIVEIPVEEYLVGVVFSEMPASFHAEALKAQAVAARTFTARMLKDGKHSDYDLCADSSCCQAWNSEADIKSKLGDSWQIYLDKVQKAVQDTEKEIITYREEPIDAVYFSCSGGSTEPAVAVWGTDVPYLQSVSSQGEESASKYQSEKKISIMKFKDIILSENSNTVFSTDPKQWVEDQVLSEGKGVERIKIGGQWFWGTKIRSLFGLNSTRFVISVIDDDIVFEVLGYGHRVGMSQYGANAMAEQGSDYQAIIKHYYTDVEIEKWESKNSSQE